MIGFEFNKKIKYEGKPGKVKIFDTTLRDGEQTPGVGMTRQDKVEIATALSKLGVDVIEAGFPVSSQGEFEAVKAVAEAGLKSRVCALARCVEKDMDAAMDCNVDLVHIFIGTSPIHRKYKLKMNEEEILKKAEQCIQYVKDRGFKVHFSPEDACRTELPYLKKVCKLANDMKVSEINIPDTVGVMTPQAMHWLIKELKSVIKVPIAVHCHNDFGLAVSNTLAAVAAGAVMPHVTVNGLGERAGNADFEQVVLGCKILYGIDTGIKLKDIYSASKIVERVSGIKVMPNFPIVGDNAFAHQSGVHVHGVLAKAATYEPIAPEMVGAKRRMVLGKLIGAHGIKDKLEQFSIKVNEEQLQEITSKVKELGAKGKKLVEEDLIAIAEDVLGATAKKERIVELLDMKLHSELHKKPVATVKVTVNGKPKTATKEGVGPVDATLNAIKKAVGDESIRLDEYHLDAITGGSDALAEVTIRVSRNGNSTIARGVNEDVVMASVIAFINGLNRILKK
ncbi:MAG: 2-isopropylmalate synthase [Candidatus Altiarchaeales archaeon]|nr:2-isopropylmalate synthase [Candidatus Altiarchaeales archaeon]